jgi:hypothetical protein
LGWFDKVVDQDLANPNLRSIVVGMHAALPESISRDHSMNEWLDKKWQRGIETGTRVYRKLLSARKSKNVYVLASHSHYFMQDIFNTQYWRSNGGVLQGWIVGTAGAQRYPLPEHPTAKEARTDVYGYLLGTVDSSGGVSFTFKETAEDSIPGYVKKRYPPGFVHWCFEHNRKGDDTLPLCPACR